MKTSKKRWINFNFSLENEITSQDQSNNKKKTTNKKIKNPLQNFSNGTSKEEKRNFNFELSLRPKTVSDLAVHPKKIKEVELWLQDNVCSRKTNQQTASFLLISGPLGSGKTTTLQVLCSSLSINISEWVNPMDQDFEIFRGPNQTNRFIEFLTESKWNSLFSSNDNKIILVEEFPNAVIRNPQDFESVLEECYFKGNYPVIFICADSFNNGKNLSELLFPVEIKNKYKITHISFNSCAVTLMKNALKRAHSLVQENLDLFKTPSSNTVDAILATSMGDIRCAINQYYFASLLGTADLPTVNDELKKTTGNKRKRKENTSSVKLMARDETLGLFHGLGRILNPKRVEIGNSWRLNCDIEKLIDEFTINPGTFTSFLFENYIKYFGDINDVCNASEILSLSQTFLEKWIDHHDTLIFALWVSVMGLMIYNEHKVSRWNQIKGPTKVNKRININPQMKHFSVTDFYYYNIINKNEISQFKTF